MSNFQINDTIEHVRLNEVIAKGVITKGPFTVDKIDHYIVNWFWTEDNCKWKNTKEDLICDIPSKKYRYRLAQEGA